MGHFESVDLAAANLFIEGQVRHMKELRGPNGQRLIVIARNDDKLEILRPLALKPQATGTRRLTPHK